ncbi:MAG: WbqC family protein [Candidatus Omnitrophica bacterium]|nr:WbqC family protein [Candidatus Omnitrophota bacterium]
MRISVHQPQYLPWLGYFHKIFSSDVFVFLDDVQYKKREFQNRNKIKNGDDWMWLTVPVVGNEDPYPNLSDVFIDNEQDWQRRHWRAIYLNYKHAPYFKDHCDFFENVYNSKWDRLNDLNMALIKYIDSSLGIEKPVYLSSEFKLDTVKTQRIIDICKALKADTYLSGLGGKDYLEEDRLAESSIRLEYQDFHHPVYKQLNMKDKDSFIPCLSTIDLLFNHGPESIDILTGRKDKMA